MLGRREVRDDAVCWLVPLVRCKRHSRR